MKKFVIQTLNERGFSHVFSEKLYKYYYYKTTKDAKGGNAYLIGLSIFDMFIQNHKEVNL